MSKKFAGWCKDKPTIVACTAREWCGHCKPLEAEWVKLKSVNGVDVHFTQCDDIDEACVNLNNKKLTDALDIGSFPTILVFAPKEKKFYRYGERRDALSILHFAKEKMGKPGLLEEYRVTNPLLLQTCDHRGQCIGK